RTVLAGVAALADLGCFDASSGLKHPSVGEFPSRLSEDFGAALVDISVGGGQRHRNAIDGEGGLAVQEIERGFRAAFEGEVRAWKIAKRAARDRLARRGSRAKVLQRHRVVGRA